MTLNEKITAKMNDWFNGLKIYKQNHNLPARGTIAAALIITEKMKDDFNLDLDHYRAQGKSQFSGVSGSAVSKILAKYGETRQYTSEGGRTNRGAAREVGDLLETIKLLEIVRLPADKRNDAINEIQKFLVEKVGEYFKRRRIEFVFDPSKTAWKTIQDILKSASDTGKEGPVAQYLIGAKLQIRFPHIGIGNESYSTADDQLGRVGDFLLHDTAFHVTVAPMNAVYEKCKRNIDIGLKVYLLVPNRSLEGARQNVELTLPDKVAVESIESFVSQNLEELSEFSRADYISGLRRLLKTYNKRVDIAELDKSMMIEIPNNL